MTKVLAWTLWIGLIFGIFLIFAAFNAVEFSTRLYGIVVPLSVLVVASWVIPTAVVARRRHAGPK